MSYARQMLTASQSRIPDVDPSVIATCVEACLDCAQACTTCADACMAEPAVQELVRCIRLNLHCGDLCATTGRIVSRQESPELARAVLEACLLACRLCAEECERHGEMGMQHCRVCAEACRRCAEACEALLKALPH